MSSQEPKEVFSANEKASNVILLFLLTFRLVDHYLLSWIFGTSLPSWVPYWYAGIAYILTVVIVGLNRHRLTQLNIDRPFVVALILGGLLYMFHLGANIGIFVAITTGFVYWAYLNNHFLLKNTAQYPPGTMLLISILIPLPILPLMLYGYTTRILPNLQMIITSLFEAQLGLVIFEEVLFRGALWAYLRDLGVKERTAFFLQAFLFWIAHSKFLFLESGYRFWVARPLVSLLLGFLAWRSKSLAPSTVGHFLYNFTSVLFKKML